MGFFWENPEGNADLLAKRFFDFFFFDLGITLLYSPIELTSSSSSGSALSIGFIALESI